MTGDTTVLLIRLFAIFIAVSVAVSLVVRRLALPYSVVLVACGLAAGALVQRADAEIPPQLVLLVLLPGLVFEAAYKIDLRLLRPAVPAVILLAGPGVVISAAIVAVALHAAGGMSLGAGFVVGAIVSATDPAAVVAAFRRLGAPRQLAVAVEAESLFNDGTGIVMFSIAAAALVAPLSTLDALVSFITIAAASVAIGGIAGHVGTRLMLRLGDHVLELTMSLLLAYGTYLVADTIHQSGVISAAVAGLVLGNEGRRLGLAAETFRVLDTVWDFLAYLLTALVFLLVGLAIPAASLVPALPSIACAVVAVLAARAALVYGVVGVLRAAPSPLGYAPPIEWLHVMVWSGLRGAVAVALALSLSPDVPDRARIQEVAFGVVLFTLAVQATTVDALLQRLRLTGSRPQRHGRPSPTSSVGDGGAGSTDRDRRVPARVPRR